MNVRMRFGAALLVLLLLSPVVSAAVKEVEVHDNFFTPERETVAVGDAVEWDGGGAQSPHNVRQDSRLFHSGYEELGLQYRVVFSAGTFHYFCETHGGRSVGMQGRVSVPVVVRAGPTGPSFTVQWATDASRSGSRYDVQYRVGARDWRNWFQDTTKLKATFGTGGSPDTATRGTRYRFRARSQKGSNGQAVSGWSPLASYIP